MALPKSYRTLHSVFHQTEEVNSGLNSVGRAFTNMTECDSAFLKDTNESGACRRSVFAAVARPMNVHVNIGACTGKAVKSNHATATLIQEIIPSFTVLLN